MPALNRYQLEIQDSKENIFVTQLNERSEDDNIRRFPVVKESADKLLQSGINTLQKTAMLRQAVSMEEVDRELAEKREEFKKRMEVCKVKKDALIIKEEALKNKMQKFDKFLKENTAKRNRALNKYQQEVKNNKYRAKELENLLEELQLLQKQRDVLLQKLDKFKIYETYLSGVIDVLPENYLDTMSDSMIHTLIQRYEGLDATNSGLVQRNHDLSSEIENGQRELEEINVERKNNKLLINSQMSKLLEEKESLLERNKKLEQVSSSAINKKRSHLGEIGRITMAINNLAEVCRGKSSASLNKLTYIQKMTMIQNFITEKIGVKNMVDKMMISTEYINRTVPSLGDDKFKRSVTTIKGVNTMTPTSDLTSVKTIPTKHKILPPISGVDQSTLMHKSNKNLASNSFLEKLEAISESVAE